MSTTAEPDEDSTAKMPNEIGQPTPMNTWERGAAGAIGLAASGAGTTAVFISDNQAGTAALFVVAVAFLLICVQGTPLRRFASGDHSAEFERRHQARTKVEEAIEAKKDGDQESAETLVEDAIRIDPSVESNPVVQAIRYERRVAEALDRVFGYMSNFSLADGEDDPDGFVPVASRRYRPDFILSANGERINVEVKHLPKPIRVTQLRHLMAVAQRTRTPMLLIMNFPLPKNLAEILRADQGPGFEAVHWTGGNDDDLLQRAVSRLLDR